MILSIWNVPGVSKPHVPSAKLASSFLAPGELHSPQRMSQNGGKDLNHKKAPQQTGILGSAFALIGVGMEDVLHSEHLPGTESPYLLKVILDCLCNLVTKRVIMEKQKGLIFFKNRCTRI